VGTAGTVLLRTAAPDLWADAAPRTVCVPSSVQIHRANDAPNERVAEKCWLGPGDRLTASFRDCGAQALTGEVQPLLAVIDAAPFPVNLRIAVDRGIPVEQTVQSRRSCEFPVPQGAAHDVSLEIVGSGRIALGFDLSPDRAGRPRFGLTLRGSGGGLAGNIAFALFHVLCFALLLTGVVVGVSAFLSTWVSAFFGFAFYLLGNLLPIAREVVETGLPAWGAHAHGGGGPTGETIAGRLLIGFLQGLTAIFPDTERLDASRPLLEGTPIPASMLVDAAFHAAIPALVFLLGGWLVLRRRDLC